MKHIFRGKKAKKLRLKRLSSPVRARVLFDLSHGFSFYFLANLRLSITGASNYRLPIGHQLS